MVSETRKEGHAAAGKGRLYGLPCQLLLVPPFFRVLALFLALRHPLLVQLKLSLLPSTVCEKDT